MKITRILVPTDFSECALTAIPVAASLARERGAEVICLHVVEPLMPTMSYAPMAEAVPFGDLSDEVSYAAARELPHVAAHAEFAGIKVEEVVAHGDAATEIVRVATERGVDLIVVASHGRTGLDRLLFGSTAEAVARHAACPVLIVKPSADCKA